MDDIVRSVQCADEPELRAIRETFYSEFIALSSAPALRVLIVHRPEGDSLLLSINHTITDGVGALRFVHSIARTYSGRADPVPAVDPLAARALRVEFGRATSPQTRTAGRPKNPRGTPTFVTPDRFSEQPGYGFIHLTMPSEQRRQLDARRFGASATNNDLLLAALHLTIAAWNNAHHEAAGVIVVLMPVNFRPLQWFDEVVGNLTLGGRIITTSEQRSTPRALMTAVMDRTQWLKTGGGGLPLLFSLPAWLYGMTPVPLISRLLGDLRLSSVLQLLRESRLASCRTSVQRPGVNITEVWGSPPVIVPTGIAIGAGILRGRLLTTLRYCRAVLDDAAATRFAEMLMQNLLDLGTAKLDERGK